MQNITSGTIGLPSPQICIYIYISNIFKYSHGKKRTVSRMVLIYSRVFMLGALLCRKRLKPPGFHGAARQATLTVVPWTKSTTSSSSRKRTLIPPWRDRGLNGSSDFIWSIQWRDGLLPSGKLTDSIWKLPLIVDLPIKNGGSVQFVA